MTRQVSDTPRSSKWRYRAAGLLAIAAIALCLASYLTKPTTNVFSDVGAAQLHRMVWFAMGGMACLAIGGALAAWELVRRRDARTEARSPISRQEYIRLLQAMLRHARLDSDRPARADDIRQLLELVKPAGVLDATPQLEGK